MRSKNKISHKMMAVLAAALIAAMLLTGCGGGGGDSGGDGTGAEYTWRMALNGSAPGELHRTLTPFRRRSRTRCPARR